MNVRARGGEPKPPSLDPLALIASASAVRSILHEGTLHGYIRDTNGLLRELLTAAHPSDLLLLKRKTFRDREGGPLLVFRTDHRGGRSKIEGI
jgi:hypothetical protein